MEDLDGKSMADVDPLLNKVALGKIGPQAADLVKSLIDKESAKVMKDSYSMFKSRKMGDHDAFVMMQELYILEKIKKDIEKLFQPKGK